LTSTLIQAYAPTAHLQAPASDAHAVGWAHRYTTRRSCARTDPTMIAVISGPLAVSFTSWLRAHRRLWRQMPSPWLVCVCVCVCVVCACVCVCVCARVWACSPPNRASRRFASISDVMSLFRLSLSLSFCSLIYHRQDCAASGADAARTLLRRITISGVSSLGKESARSTLGKPGVRGVSHSVHWMKCSA
jgi:hypothetical protein